MATNSFYPQKLIVNRWLWQMAKYFLCIFLIAMIFAGLTFFDTIKIGAAQNSSNVGEITSTNTYENLANTTSISQTASLTYRQYSSGSNRYGGALDDWAYSIKLTIDNGLILAGYTRSYGAGGSDMWLIKTVPTSYSLNGKIVGAYQKPQWNMTFGGAKDEGALSVIQTADGGYAVVGYANSFGAGLNDMWLVKTASNGKMQWNVTFGGAKNDDANSVIQTADGGYLLAGYTNSGVQSQSAWIVKTDASGKMEWNEILPGLAANSVIQTNDDGYALAIQYSDSFGLVKIDSSGNILLNQIYGSSSDQASAQAVIQADDGGYAISGWIASTSTGVNSAWLVKTDELGQEQWNRTYIGLGGYALIKTMEGGYALTGDRAFLIMTDSLGNVEWNQVYDEETGNGSQYFTRMQSIIEASPNHFVMAGVHDDGPYVNLQFNWIQVALKSGAQTIPPKTTILSPNNTTYGNRDIPLTFYVDKPTQFLMYRVNGLTNFTMSGNTTLTNLPNGEYSITVFATDYDYNTAPSQTEYFIINSNEPYVLPKVTIKSPINQTYSTNQLLLDYSVDQPILWTAYSLDGGDNITAIPNLRLYPLTNGSHTLTVYAGGIPGGEAGSATVNFNVSIPQQPTPYTIPYSPGDASYKNTINELIGVAVNFYETTTFLLIAVLFLVVALSLVIAVLLITRRSPRSQKPPA